jgi:hypothetical protein
MNDEELLNDLYYVQLNFDGANVLFQKARKINKNIKLDFVKTWLAKQATHQQNSNKSAKRVFLPIYTESHYGYQIDLTFFPKYKKQNDGNYVLFTAININTRYAYAYYSDSKDAKTILEIMKRFHKDCHEIDIITTDEGTEFTNEYFDNYCIENDITIFFCKGDSHKLGIINRFHRTLKDKLTKYFNSKDTVRWIDILDKIIYNYNHTVNTGIGLEPYKANSFIQTEIISNKAALTDKMQEKHPVYEVGKKCRIINSKELFDDKMTAKYSNFIYTITEVTKNSVILNNDIKKKKSQVLLISDDTQAIVPNVHQEAVKTYNKAKNKFNRSGLDPIYV